MSPDADATTFRFSIFRVLVLTAAAAGLVVAVRPLPLMWPFKAVIFLYLAMLVS